MGGEGGCHRKKQIFSSQQRDLCKAWISHFCSCSSLVPGERHAVAYGEVLEASAERLVRIPLIESRSSE